MWPFKKKEDIKEVKISNFSKYFWHIFLMILYIVLYFAATLFLFKKHQIHFRISFGDFLLLTLAIFRVTRLFVYDEIMNFIRDFFASGKSGLFRSLTELINCPWCTGVWVSLVMVFLYLVSPIFWMLILILALAGFSAILQVIYKTLARYGDSLKQTKK